MATSVFGGSPDMVNRSIEEYDSDESISEQSTDEEEDNSSGIKRSFEEIRDELRSNTLDLRAESDFERFVSTRVSYLGESTSATHDTTLLHMIVEDVTEKRMERYQRLVDYLLDKHPSLVKRRDGNDVTPMFLAINNKRYALIRAMCNRIPESEMDSILSIRSNSINCIHKAIIKGFRAEKVIPLIAVAGQDTLCARDGEGKTPLHLAVQYDRCTESQLEVVRKLVERCDEALNVTMNAPRCFSPYQYHIDTCAEAERKRANEKSLRDHDTERLEAYSSAETRAECRASPAAENGSLSKVDSSHSIVSKEQISPNLTPAKGGVRPFGIFKHLNTRDRDEISDPELRVSDKVTSKASISNKLKEKHKEKDVVTEDTVGAIENYLKLYCMRHMQADQIIDFLYGGDQVRQTYFDMFGCASLDVSKESIRQNFAALNFENILQYVALPALRIAKKPIVSRKKSTNTKQADGKGRADMIFMFQFLRDKGVRRIVRVIVDDRQEPTHSDEAIEEALIGFQVEKWDWRRLDICSDTVLFAAPNVREICLYWSGNNAILQGWSARNGLHTLKSLETVNLHIEKGLENTSRTSRNVEEFRTRMRSLNPGIDIKKIEGCPLESHGIAGSPSEAAQRAASRRHIWLTCMDEFADFIQNVRPPEDIHEEITIALIDDGVDMSEKSLHGRIHDGRSFSFRDKENYLTRSFYVTSGGHGTVMANLITRICPKSRLYILKVDEYMDKNGTRQITAESAAKAIRAAVDRKVHIISMSWRIERTAYNRDSIRLLESAIEDAAKAGILMFCAANDQDDAVDDSFPAACRTKRLFRIGAAEAHGQVWKWMGENNNIDFIFPGHDEVKERPGQAPLDRCSTVLTGSSVATAIAAGYAALVLYCMQLAALSSRQPDQSVNVITMNDFNAMKGHLRMAEAFQAIGTTYQSGNKYIEVWNVFGHAAAKAAENPAANVKLEIVREVAQRLKKKKTLW